MTPCRGVLTPCSVRLLPLVLCSRRGCRDAALIKDVWNCGGGWLPGPTKKEKGGGAMMHSYGTAPERAHGLVQVDTPTQRRGGSVGSDSKSARA